MIDEQKTSRAISNINKLTATDKIIWKTRLHSSDITLAGEEKIVGPIYESQFDNRPLRLFKYSETVQTDEFDFRQFSFVRLSVLDNTGQSVWDFPKNRGLEDLYESVRFKVSGI